MLSLSDIVNVKVGIGRGVFEAPGATVIGGKKPSFSLEILKLFANGEQGFFYDPNDLSTMFQDASGTVPVTGAGQPVGLIKDKSGRGNHAYQTVSASRPILSDRVNVLDNSTPVTTGGSWGLTRTTLSYPSVQTPHGIKNVALVSRTEVGNCYISSKPTTVLPSLTRKVVFSAIVKVNNATYASIRLQEKYPARVDAIFNLATGTAHFVGQVGDVFTDPKAEIKNLGDGWYYINASGIISTPNTSTGYISFSSVPIQIDGNEPTTTAAGYVYGADLRAYSTTTPVSLPLTQEVELGVTKTKDFPYYLAFDGVDDFLQTNNIDFTATDKVSLFVGVRKLSDASAGMLCELGPNVSTTAGTFFIAAPPKAAAQISAASNGTVARYADADNLLAPISTVISASSDITANTLIIRVNGTQSMKNTISQGGGKYANYPLYIGRRNGTSAPFNGHIYSLIGIGRLTTDDETTALEKELAKRTGVTLSV